MRILLRSWNGWPGGGGRNISKHYDKRMTAVNADMIIPNTRSQHVLEKIGFQFIGEKADFIRNMISM